MAARRHLLDTNVIAELLKAKPAPSVTVFLNSVADAWLSVMVFHELAYGIDLCPDPIKQPRLWQFVDHLRTRFKHRTLPIDLNVASAAGRLRAIAASKGLILDPIDALMGATAVNYDAVLVTRNAKVLQSLGIDIVNL